MPVSLPPVKISSEPLLTFTVPVLLKAKGVLITLVPVLVRVPALVNVPVFVIVPPDQVKRVFTVMSSDPARIPPVSVRLPVVVAGPELRFKVPLFTVTAVVSVLLDPLLKLTVLPATVIAFCVKLDPVLKFCVPPVKVRVPAWGSPCSPGGPGY